MASNKSLSLLLRLAGTRCTVIGDDALAEQWARFVCEQGAKTNLIHPSPSQSILNEASSPNGLKVASRQFAEEDVQDCDWMIVTLSDRESCEMIAGLAQQHHVWAAFLRFPDLGAWVIPQAFSFESFQILLPVGTPDPQLHERLSRAWRRFLPADFSRAVQLLHSIEKRVNDVVPDRRHRTRVFDSLFESHFAELLAEGRWQSAKELAEKVVQSFAEDPARRQRVSPRIGVQLHVTFSAGGHSFSGKLFNLSRDGAFIATKHLLPRLTHVTSITFTLPTGEIIHNAEGFVVWENSPLEPRAPIYPSGFALMFDSLSSDHLKAIESYVQGQLG